MTKKKPKSEHKEGGRPTKMTPELVGKLKDYFAKGLSDSEACLMVNINKSTLYDYCKLNPDFSNQKEELKKQPALKAKLNIVQDIKLGDINTSKWYLERKCKDEFSLRTEQTGKNGDPIQEKIVYVEKEETEELEKHIEEFIKQESTE